MGQAIPSTLEQYAAGQLGRPTSHSSVCAQLLAQRNNEELTVQVAHGERTKDNMGGKENEGPNSGQPPPRYTTCLQQGTGMHQTHATPHGRKGQNKIYALRPRSPSLARRG